MRRLIGIMSLMLATVVLGMGAATRCLAQNWNFETGDLRSWTTTGTAFSQQPTLGDNVSARLPGVRVQQEGNYWIGTFESRSNPAAPAGGIQGDAPTGTLTSTEFTIAGPHISFLIGGGNDVNRLRLELLVKIGSDGSVPPPILGLLGIGERVHLSDGEYFVGLYGTGRNTESMRREMWDVSVYMNRRARIRIKDDSSRPWGHINVDDIRLDSPIAGTQGDVWVTGMEITQAVQTFPGNAVPLILHKPTMVRVYVAAREDSRGPWSDVSANLVVRRGRGGPQLGPTLRPVTSNAEGAIAVSPGGSDRGSFSDSLNFILNPEQTDEREIEVEVRTFSLSRRSEFDTNNNLLSSTFHFQPIRDMAFYCLSYRYSTPPSSTAAVFSEFEPHRAWAQNALPLANLWADPFPGYPIGNIAHRSVQNDDGSFRDDGYVDARAWAQQMIDRLQPDGGAWVVLMQPEFDAGYHGAHYVDGVGNHVINMQRNTFDPGPTLAHEIAHGWGQAHTWENPAFPHANGGLGNQVGVRFFQGILQILSSPSHHDIMSYTHPQWFSPYTYTEILRQMSDGRLVVPEPVRDARLQLAPQSLPLTVEYQPQFVKAAYKTPLAGEQNTVSGNDQAYLYISGWITQDSATFLPFEKVTLSKRLSIRPTGNSYRLILEDASGKLLGENRFDKPVVADDGPNSKFLFSMYVAINSDISRIALVDKAGTVLAERRVTANSPHFTKFGCNCNESLRGKRKIYWESRDADGDALTYSVWYSTNRGQTWIPQQFGLTQNSFEVDFDRLPGSDQAMIRVIASDGVNTAEVRLPQLLHVRNKKPSVAIAPLAPLTTGKLSSIIPAATLPRVFVSEAHPLVLFGSSFDYEDGRINDRRAFRWTSDRDGQLGTGSWIALSKLSSGKHRITLSVSDSGKLLTSTFLEVVVRRK